MPNFINTPTLGATFSDDIPMTLKLISRLLFHKDSFILIVTLAFLWVTISLMTDSKIKSINLERHKGVVLNIDSVVTGVKDRPLFKQTTQELRLTINTDRKYFTTTTTGSFKYITSKIKIGDTVTILTKPKVFLFFGLKKVNDISQLVKGDTTIIDYEEYRVTAKKLFIFSAIMTIISASTYYFWTQRRLKALRSEAI